MYFIETNGTTTICVNSPADGIEVFFAQNYGADCRAVASASVADHSDEMGYYLATVTGEGGLQVSAGNVLPLVPGTLTIQAHDPAGNLLKSWTGVQVYPAAPAH